VRGADEAVLESSVVQTRSQRNLLLIGGPIFALVFVAMALNPPSGPHARSGSGTAAVGFVLAGLVLVAFVRLARCRCVIGNDGIVVHNPLRRVSVAWSDIEGFRVGRHGLWRRICIASVAGRPDLAMWGIQGLGPAATSQRDPVYRLVDRLNDALRAHGR
jgi:hypothetical protein